MSLDFITNLCKTVLRNRSARYWKSGYCFNEFRNCRAVTVQIKPDSINSGNTEAASEVAKTG